MSTETSALHEALLRGNFRVVDLTHVINNRMPAFDNKQDAFVYETYCSVEENGCFAGAFQMDEHYGTHMDAPAHFVSGAATIDKLAVNRLILPAVVIDVRKEVQADCDYCLTLEKVKQFEKDGSIPNHSAVLLLTGWDERFHSAEDYRNVDEDGRMHFPGYSLEAAAYLVGTRKVSALGIDTLSIDFGFSDTYSVHKEVLASTFFIENLTKLDSLPARGAVIFCGALPIEGGSGCPARVLALVP
jgi:kynurenine formamidase